jgi:hypothetical protein
MDKRQINVGGYAVDETAQLEQIRENQVALFNLVCTLIYKMTGEIPLVRVWTKNGAVLTAPSLDDVINQEETS